VRWSTVIISVGLHLGVAASLITVAERKGLGKKNIVVSVTGEKKKETPKPPPPKPIAKPAAPKPTVVAKADTPSAPVRAAPVATNLAMSNADLDVGPGIGLEGRAKPTAAAAPVKTASNISEARTRRAKEEATGGGLGEDQPCNEDPTRPTPISQTAIDYTVYPQAQADGIEGKFKARLAIDTNGEVSAVDVVTSIDPGFDAAIVAALKRWRFKPAMACGKPVASTMPFSARFELGD
jgi:protein TonB